MREKDRPEERLAAFGASVGMILGSGLAGLADSVETEFSIPYKAIPGLPQPRVTGHDGRFVAGRLGGVRVIVACGRVHLYEGWEARDTAAGVRLLARCGVRILLVFNAAGSLDPAIPPGDWMLIADHLNLTARSPLNGESGFVDMVNAYSPRLRRAFVEGAHERGLTLREGVYAAVLGPQFETAAEIRMLRVAGAGAVGMSTVHEAIQARALGLEVAGFSAVSNWAAGVGEGNLSHAEVLRNGARAVKTMTPLLVLVLPRL